MNENNTVRPILIFCLLIIANWSFGQSVIFDSQAEVDAFDPTTEIIIGDLFIGSEQDLSYDIVDISNLANISRVSGSLFVRGTLLENLDGLSNLEHIGTELEIHSNTLLTNVDGLSKLNVPLFKLGFFDNPLLTNLDGLSNIPTVYTELHLFTNGNLLNLDGLSGLTTIGGKLWVIDNNSMIHLDGLYNVESLRDLSIVSNASLERIGGLSQVHTLGFLSISQNDNLTSLEGLNGLESIEVHCSIRFNPLLSDCCAIQNILSDPDAIGGTVTIDNSLSECSSQEEVLDANCSVSTEDLSEIEWSISPNVTMAGSYINISTEEPLQNANISLRSLDGRFVMSQKLTNSYFFIPTTVSSGLYLLSIESKASISTKKILVQE